MYDPELKYCPACREEYVAEAVKCAECEIDLVSGREMMTLSDKVQKARQSRAGTIEPGDDIVTVHRGQMQEIKAIEKKLAEERIATLVAGDEKSCGKGCCPTTLYLNVRREDAMDALRIIEQEFERTTAIDCHDLSHADAVFNPDATQVQCPACGTTFTPTSSECPDCGLCF